jgi:hypothetical protein
MLRWLSGRAVDVKNKLSWRADVLPLQWRIALSWASGYLIFNLFTPTVFSRFGAVEAGKLGMALTIFSAISTIGMSWVNAKAPNFTMHISRGELIKLNFLFKYLFIRSTIATVLMSICVVLAAWFFNQHGLYIFQRIASLEVLTILAIVTICNSSVFSMATYMRAHRKEPMLIQSITIGLMIAISIYIGSKHSVYFMMISYMLICIFISLPWTIWLFSHYYKK